ncbi:MAG TPA: hypothetical protein VJ201_08850 [Candidatus Babeliales bacterium]|nr:hypothetical protein [Candidatus Babeliales bacterium]
MKEKKLVKHGNSLALVIEKPLLNVLGIDEKTNLVISIQDNSLIIKATPIKKAKNKNEIDEIAKQIMQKYAPAFKKLAKS